MQFASKDIKSNLSQQKYSPANLESLSADYAEFLNIYNLKSQGSQKMSILVKFLLNFTPFTYKSLLQNPGDSSSDGAQLNGLKQQLLDQEQKQQLLKQQNSIYQ